MLAPLDARPLLEGHWYDALAAILDTELRAGLRTPAREQALRLAVAAKRVLDLDAEDYWPISRDFQQRHWAEELGAACFPLEPRSPQRGALGSLVPLYRLMLEVLQVRALRHEPLQVVVTSHLIGEYLPQLAWESTLGHAGDPLRMASYVGERWGTTDRACPHSSAMRTTAKRSLNAANGDVAGFTAYLDRFHSRLGPTLAMCAMNHETTAAGERPDVAGTCPNPCQWALRGTLEQRRDLDARVRLALLYSESPVVALRHHAPVGHFFGVPSTAEIADAWALTWERLTAPWGDGANPLAKPGLGAPEPGEPLPGMSALVSAVAGRSVGPGTLIRQIGADIAAALAE